MTQFTGTTGFQAPQPKEPKPKRWFQSKTVWASLSLIAVTLGGVAFGFTAEQIGAVATCIGALGAIFMRDAIEKAPQRQPKPGAPPGAPGVAVLLFMLPCGLFGCSVSPAEHKAFGLYLDRVGKEYLQYVEDDPNLTDEDKQDRRDFHKTSREAWQEGEQDKEAGE